MLPKNPFNYGTQAHLIFERLKQMGTITTKEIHILRCDTARLRSDIRPVLRKHGMDYRVKYIEPGNRLYEVKR